MQKWLRQGWFEMTDSKACNAAGLRLVPGAQQKNDVQGNEHRDNNFQYEHAELVELRDHELVEFSGRLQFLADQHLVILYAGLGRDDSVNARIIRVADKFYGIFRALSQIHDVEAKAIHAAGAARQAPAGEKTFVALERAVYVRKQIREDFIVIAKLQ